MRYGNGPKTLSYKWNEKASEKNVNTIQKKRKIKHCTQIVYYLLGQRSASTWIIK